jgi:hypothetical protein
MIDYKKIIALTRMRFALGLGIVGMFTSVIGMLTFAKVWEDTFKFYDIPLITVYVSLPLGFFISCWIIGYLYDIKGIWKEENSHTNLKLNPELLVILSRLQYTVTKLDELERKIDDISKERK